MKPFVNGMKVFWRSERLLRQNELRLITQKVLLNLLAGLVAIFGLVMLSVAVFFVLVPHWGQPLAALAVSGADFFLALGLVLCARSLKPDQGIKMVKEMREMALSSMEEDIAGIEAGIVSLNEDIRKIIRNPVEMFLPMAIGPILGAAVRGLKSQKKQPDDSKDSAADNGEKDSFRSGTK